MTDVIGDAYKYYEGGFGFIEQCDGTPFQLMSDDLSRIKLPVIAHALSLNCRFNGQIKRFYSVAQHSIMVAELTRIFGGNARDYLEALLHDASEAYLSDVPAPFKQFLPDLRRIDALLEGQIRDKYALPPAKSDIVQKADWYALFIEADALLPSHGERLRDPHNLRRDAIHLGVVYDLFPRDERPDHVEDALLGRLNVYVHE